MTQLVTACVVGLIVAVTAAVLTGRAKPKPMRMVDAVPSHLARSDFASPEKPWAVIVFSSPTCGSCERVLTAIKVLAGEQLAVDDVPFSTRRDLHERYGITSVPTTLVVDNTGDVKASWVGAFSTEEIWAAVDAAKA